MGGRRFIGSLFNTAMVHLVSAVVAYFDVIGITIDELEANTPLVAGGDGVLSLSTSG